jgi:hydroxyacylglutathione hydrolase
MKQLNRDGVPLLRGLPVPGQITDSSELQSIATKATIIDTRPWNEVRDGHLPHSIWSPANASFHRFAGSFVSADDDIVFIVTQKNLERAILNAVRIGLDNIIAWADPTVLQGVNVLDVMPEITASELDSLHDIAVLDVRRKQEFNAGAIPNAKNIAHTRLLNQLDELDPSIPMVVNCHGGSRSAAACMALRRNGYAVTNLAGGYSGWKANAQPSLASK